MALNQFEFLDSYINTKSEAEAKIPIKIAEIDEKAKELQDSLSKAPHFYDYKAFDLKSETNEFELKLEELTNTISELNQGFDAFKFVVKPRISKN